MCLVGTVLTFEFATDLQCMQQRMRQLIFSEIQQKLFRRRDETETPVAAAHTTGSVVMEAGCIVQRVSDTSTNSGNFLDALRRDRLFDYDSVDDLNVGEDDWSLLFDSDSEVDEDTILLDEGEDEDEVSGVMDGVDGEEVITMVLVEFELTDDELHRLQANGWDTSPSFDEHHSNQVLLDAAPLYKGP
ncbi:hypothetical protein PHPALM_31778 [Phytophthora palmivora]|uniref:Uncharacterized protein n=1 Tax=Phytophthora palmivora TaxID=4796 RepID=A0A2P4X1Q9_9STRA|nr:hypothetical protein PHPALM_31778 [Phytophthora palmivora]